MIQVSLIYDNAIELVKENLFHKRSSWSP